MRLTPALRGAAPVALLAALCLAPSAYAQTSTGLGGYQMCTTTNFTLTGNLDAIGPPPAG